MSLDDTANNVTVCDANTVNKYEVESYDNNNLNNDTSANNDTKKTGLYDNEEMHENDSYESSKRSYSVTYQSDDHVKRDGHEKELDKAFTIHKKFKVPLDINVIDVNKLYSKYVKGNTNNISIAGNKNITKASLEDTIEIEMDHNLFCHGCKQIKEYCHDTKYSDYCMKKMVFMYRNYQKDYSEEEVKSNFTFAYNEIRRIDIYNRFKFYDGHMDNIPGCLECCLDEAQILVSNLKFTVDTNEATKKGIVEYLRAKRFRRA